MSNIAIFGGTFNPFHIGHYQMLEYVCGLDFIDRVLLIPDKIPPHKSCDFLASDTDRIEMCRLVCNDFCKAELCLAEFEREGKSYTVYTVNLLKKKYINDNFFTVIGGDMLATLDTWYNWQLLIKKTAFIAFRRVGSSDFENHLKRMKNYGAQIIVADKEIADISSTLLRGDMRRELLPEKVYQYIKNKGIYNA